ncbi:MerR family transcriptional regulator [Pseudomonas sp. JDS28PS106]|uniref:MerR family transcriptional regulator n=1 Tax=Pseudomonas sp. JDS28PS106 TaxID=2497235 RepID=UPI002FCF75F9
MNLPDQPTLDSDAQSSGDWLPIREVARQTGVNAVTLRAWERRYGLIVPHRTAKGHRLYSQEHVQRVMTILTWLNRGVSVSRIKSLIDSEQPETDSLDDDWSALRNRLQTAIGQLAERKVDDVFNQAMSLYPPRTLCAQLMSPLLAELEQRWQGRFGARLERTFFYSWLRSKLGARIYHNNRQLNGPPLVLINQSDLPFEPHLWLTAWLVSSADCPVEVFDWPLPVEELAMAGDILKPRGIVLYSSHSLSLTPLPRLVAAVSCPVVLSGPAVRIHEAELQAGSGPSSNLTLAHDPLDTQSELSRLGLI